MAATARILQFANGTTNIVTGSFNVKGSSGAVMTVQSNTAAVATLSANIGIISCDYIQPIWMKVIGGSGWLAGLNSTDGGNNSGWVFMKDAQVQVSSVWKKVSAMQIKVGGAWKTVSKAQVQVSGVWKAVF